MSDSPTSQPLAAELVEACQHRQNRLRQHLDAANADAVLLTHDRDIFYLTGFIGHDTFLLIWPDGAAIITDPRFDEQLDPWRHAPLGEVMMGVRHRLHETLGELCTRHGLSALAIASEHTTLAQHETLAQTLPDVSLRPVRGLVATLRQCKDDLEVRRIEAAAALQVEALNAAWPALEEPGITEQGFCARLEYEMKRRGASGPSFSTIVASGANSSVPHHETGHTAIGPGTLLIDWGAHLNGYNSDMTRTFGIGAMPTRIREIYQIVLDAQFKAIEAIRPGVRCADIDAVARNHITDAGYGEYFAHGLGHGLGLDVHEGPYFNPLATDVELEPGMVLTVEPGIYLPGVGGVRIEDDVLVLDQGVRVLSSAPKELEQMTVESAAVSAGSTSR